MKNKTKTILGLALTTPIIIMMITGIILTIIDEGWIGVIGMCLVFMFGGGMILLFSIEN